MLYFLQTLPASVIEKALGITLSLCLPEALSHLNCSIEGVSLSLNFLQVGHDLEIIVKSERDYVLTVTCGSGIYLHLINPGNRSFCCPNKHAALVPYYDTWSVDRVGSFSDLLGAEGNGRERRKGEKERVQHTFPKT